jgi:hypothetical protein
MKLRTNLQRSALLVCVTLTLLGCRTDPEPAVGPSTEKPVGLRLGKPLQGLPKTPLADILDHPEKYDGRTVAVEGLVARACTRKGCWMEISEQPGEAARACRVTFEDYAFFVPKDSPGSRTRLEGKVATSRIKPSHVEHLESEGARFSNKNPDGSALEVQIVASGVELDRHDGPQQRL